MRRTHPLVLLLCSLAACSAPPPLEVHEDAAVTRTHAQRGPRRVAPPTRTVHEFGAAGDGVTDDTDAMQAAADWLCATRGATLVYPPGTYRVGRLLDAEQHVGSLRDYSVAYVGCRDVTIRGYGARIVVEGAFTKSIAEEIDGFGVPAAFADRFATIPFLFEGSAGFVLEGFEIDGNADQTRVSHPGYLYVEGHEHGISTGNCRNYELRDLHVHHMLADGILIGTGTLDEDVTIRRVVVEHNARNAISLVQAREVWIVDSALRSAGDVEGGPGGYPLHSPARGIAMEADCHIETATWGQPEWRCPGFAISGNFLFERLEITGNLGGGVSAAHGDRTANVTIRDSLIANPPGAGGQAVTLGVPGGVIEGSTLELERGTIEACFAASDPAAYGSQALASGIDVLLRSTGLVSSRITRETRPIVSTDVRYNQIRGRGALLGCRAGIPALTIRNNDLIGQQDETAAELPEYTGLFGVLGIYDRGNYLTPGVEQANTQLLDNTIFVPATAPRNAWGEILLYGVARSARNRFVTDAIEQPFRVVYDGVASVSGDELEGAFVAEVIDTE